LEKCFYLDSIRYQDTLLNLGFSFWTETEKNRYAILLIDYYVSLFYQSLEERIQYTKFARNAYQSSGVPISESDKQEASKLFVQNRDLVFGSDVFFALHFSATLKDFPKEVLSWDYKKICQRLIHLALNRSFSGILPIKEDILYEVQYRIYLERHFRQQIASGQKNE
jgi:hypothetical protein